MAERRNLKVFRVKQGLTQNEMADKIYSISSNEKLYKEMSDASRELAESEFSDKKYFIKMRDLYHELVGLKNEKID